MGLTFCKKAADIPGMLTGKWKIDSVQLRMLINTLVSYQTIYKPSSGYYDFRVDNKLYRLWMTNYDTVSYKILSLNGKSLIQYMHSADTIMSLTKHSLIFKDPEGATVKSFLLSFDQIIVFKPNLVRKLLTECLATDLNLLIWCLCFDFCRNFYTQRKNLLID